MGEHKEGRRRLVQAAEAGQEGAERPNRPVTVDEAVEQRDSDERRAGNLRIAGRPDERPAVELTSDAHDPNECESRHRRGDRDEAAAATETDADEDCGEGGAQTEPRPYRAGRH